MSLLRTLYKALPTKGLKERIKLLYYNAKREEKFRKEGSIYRTIVKGITLLTKEPLYHVVNDITVYEKFYKVKEGDVIIDAGANYGYLAIYYAKRTGANGKVFAFEPDGANIRAMNENIVLNNEVKNVDVVTDLIWNKNEEVEFYEAGTVGSSVHYKPDETKIVKKKAITIDSFVQQKGLTKLDFIKMDIEGAEIEALEGAVDTLQKLRPSMSIASYHWVNDEQTYIKVEKLLEGINYSYKSVFYDNGEIITFAGDNLNM